MMAEVPYDPFDTVYNFDRYENESNSDDNESAALSRISTNRTHGNERMAGNMTTIDLSGPTGVVQPPTGDASTVSQVIQAQVSGEITDQVADTSRSSVSASSTGPLSSRATAIERRITSSSAKSNTAQDVVILEAIIASLRAENDRVKSDLLDARRALHKSSATIAEDDQMELIMNLKLEIAEIMTKLDAATNQKRAAEDSRIAELRELLAETQRQLLEAKGDIQTLKEASPHDTNEGIIMSLKAEKAQSDERVDEAHRQLAEAREEIKRLREEKKQSPQPQSKSEYADDDETDTRILLIEEEKAKSEERVVELEKELIKLKMQIAALKTDMEGSEQSSNLLMEETAMLAEQVSNMLSERTTLMDRVKKLKQNLAKMKRSAQKLNRENTECKVRLEAAEVLAENHKTRYMRLLESMANVSMTEIEEKLDEEDVAAVREERHRKYQEKKGALRRMFEGSVIGSALSVAPYSHEALKDPDSGRGGDDGVGDGVKRTKMKRRRSLPLECLHPTITEEFDQQVGEAPVSIDRRRGNMSFDEGDLERMMNEVGPVDEPSSPRVRRRRRRCSMVALSKRRSSMLPSDDEDSFKLQASTGSLASLLKGDDGGTLTTATTSNINVNINRAFEASMTSFLSGNTSPPANENYNDSSKSDWIDDCVSTAFRDSGKSLTLDDLDDLACSGSGRLTSKRSSL